MQHIAIKASSLSKKYKLYDSPRRHMLEILLPSRRKLHQEHWALDNISFSIRKGESVGIIGVNGSGKSTLLQIICGILTPSTGECLVNGRITALLELGSGFSMDSTGRENVYLQGALLGLSRNETKQIYPAVEAFADIGGFIDKPVRTYSSGMLVRLAIAVAFQMNPDVLIIDEALAVGDIFFQAKCINKLQEMRQSGVTMVFVSHDMGTIRSLCDRLILLDQGQIASIGEPSPVIETYYARRAQHLGAVDLRMDRTPETTPPTQAAESPQPEIIAQKKARGEQRYGNGKGRLTSFTINGLTQTAEVTVSSCSMLDVALDFSIDHALANPFAAIMLRTWQGTEIFGNNTTFANTPIGPLQPRDTIKALFSQQLHLNNGQYLLTLTLAEWGENGEVVYVDRHVNAVMILVDNGPYPYSGICNLQGAVAVQVNAIPIASAI